MAFSKGKTNLKPKSIENQLIINNNDEASNLQTFSNFNNQIFFLKLLVIRILGNFILIKNESHQREEKKLTVSP